MAKSKKPESDRESSSESSQELQYDVETILSHKVTKKGTSYLVKWAVFDVKYATWEPEENLEGCDEALEVYMKAPRLNVTKGAIIEEWKQKGHQKSSEVDGKTEIMSSLTRRKTVENVEKNNGGGVEVKPEVGNNTMKPLKVDGNKPQEMNWLLFIKLGLIVSAIVILVFLFAFGEDSNHFRRMMNQRSAEPQTPQ